MANNDLQTVQKLTITVGVGRTSKDEPIPVQEQKILRDKALEYLCQQFGGALVTDGYGAWVGPDGKMLLEPNLIFSVVVFEGRPHSEFEEHSRAVRDLFRQTCVVVEVAAEKGGYV
jgi:hypothetical protein